MLQCHHRGSYLGLKLRAPRANLTLAQREESDLTVSFVTSEIDRWVKVDVDDISRAETKRITLRSDLVSELNLMATGSFNTRVYFRLMNYCIDTHYELREVWPPLVWEIDEEVALQYKPGNFLIARLNGNSDSKIAGVVLAEKHWSSHRLVICFHATPDTWFRGFRVTDPGRRILEDCCTDLAGPWQQIDSSGRVTAPNSAKIEYTDSLVGFAELKVAMYIDNVLEANGIALNVSIDDPKTSSTVARSWVLAD